MMILAILPQKKLDLGGSGLARSTSYAYNATLVRAAIAETLIRMAEPRNALSYRNPSLKDRDNFEKLRSQYKTRNFLPLQWRSRWLQQIARPSQSS
jgi:hypothetical protein